MQLLNFDLSSKNENFNEWVIQKYDFLLSYNFNADYFVPFPSHDFIDQFYFWLFKVKNQVLYINEQPWWELAPLGGGTDWPYKNPHSYKEIYIEYEKWWDLNFPKRYDFLNRFYDYENDKPFELSYYKNNFFSKNHYDFEDACRGLKYSYDWFMSSVVRNSEITHVMRDCENIVRQKYGVPKIGEGWVSETSLFYFIKTYFENETSVVHHASPEFLGRQHYDIYFPDFKIAIEYQGVQHTKPIEYFGGEIAFEKNLERDKRKKQISIENEVILIEVFPNYDEKKLISKIEKLLKNRKNKNVE